MYSKIIGETEPQKEVEQAAAKHHELLERWAKTTSRERQEILGTYMRIQIAKAIGINSSEIDMQQSTKYLGIDSLIAVKLRNQLRTDWLVDLAAVKFLDDFSICDLVILLEEQIKNAKSNTHTPGLKLEQEIQEKDREKFSVTGINDGDWLEGEI